MRYIDNDIICKLCACNIVAEAMGALGVEWGDIRILSTAKYSLRVASRRETGIVQFGASHPRICDFVSRCADIQYRRGADIGILSGIHNIDDGEAILFSAANQQSEVTLITGDKRSIRALANSPRCAAIARNLEKRVVCFEQIVLLCIEHHGYEAIRGLVVDGIPGDGALEKAFGIGAVHPEAHAVDCLTRYVQTLRSELTIDVLVEMSQIRPRRTD
ncbi:MAG: hypothetical protein QM811_22610 [Pirellulales bacterium]